MDPASSAQRKITHSLNSEAVFKGEEYLLKMSDTHAPLDQHLTSIEHDLHSAPVWGNQPHTSAFTPELSKAAIMAPASTIASTRENPLFEREQSSSPGYDDQLFQFDNLPKENGCSTPVVIDDREQHPAQHEDFVCYSVSNLPLAGPENSTLANIDFDSLLQELHRLDKAIGETSELLKKLRLS
jgi:hypothetical protein